MLQGITHSIIKNELTFLFQQLQFPFSITVHDKSIGKLLADVRLKKIFTLSSQNFLFLF